MCCELFHSATSNIIIFYVLVQNDGILSNIVASIFEKKILNLLYIQSLILLHPIIKNFIFQILVGYLGQNRYHFLFWQQLFNLLVVEGWNCGSGGLSGCRFRI